jgi:hypothetical protein
VLTEVASCITQVSFSTYPQALSQPLLFRETEAKTCLLLSNDNKRQIIIALMLSCFNILFSLEMVARLDGLQIISNVKYILSQKVMFSINNQY